MNIGNHTDSGGTVARKLPAVVYGSIHEVDGAFKREFTGESVGVCSRLCNTCDG